MNRFSPLSVQLQASHHIPPHSRTMRSLPLVLLLGCAFAPESRAQAPETGPLILLVPASARATALGNAWVAGRDEDVIFYNPAQLLSARPGFNVSIGRYGSATLGSMAGVYAAGPLTMTTGWGVEFLDYSARPSDGYPYAPAMLARGGTMEALGMLATVGTAVTWKNFRGGVAAKYVADRVSVPASGPGSGATARHDTFLYDVGISHNLWTGIAGLAVQNLGQGWTEGTRHIEVPFQTALGWTLARAVGQLDLGVATQLTLRRGWVSPGAGVELGYGWIEGYSAAVRVGARKTETNGERPVAIGATFNADRLSIEYALQFFEGDRNANRVTIRWR